MTAWTPETDRELGEYTPLRGNPDFPRIPVSRGRYPNLITVASAAPTKQGKVRSQVVADLAMALAHIGKSVLVVDFDHRGDVYERVGVTPETRPPEPASYIERSGLWWRLAMPRPGIWAGGGHAKFACRSVSELRAFLRRARLEFDYVLASVSPNTSSSHRFAFNSGLFLVVDPHAGPLLSSTAMRAVVKSLHLNEAPELCVVLRDPQDGSAGGPPATFQLGSEGPVMAAWNRLPGGVACQPEDEFTPMDNPRATDFVRLAEAIVGRTGEQAPGPQIAEPVDPRRRPAASIDAQSPAEARRVSLEVPKSSRCGVTWCRRSTRRSQRFCRRHLPDRARVAGYGVSRWGVKIYWSERCEATGCWEASRGSHCWDHERLLHPDRICGVPECDERATDFERGGTYCWDHDKDHNPHYPYASLRDRRTTRLVLAAFWAVTAPLILWIAVFGIRWYVADGPDCARGAFDWTWFGPRCQVTDAELHEASSDARNARLAVYGEQLDRSYDDLIVECAEKANRTEYLSEGPLDASEVMEMCIYTGLADLEQLAMEMDDLIDEAAQKASADLYEQRTGDPLP